MSAPRIGAKATVPKAARARAPVGNAVVHIACKFVGPDCGDLWMRIPGGHRDHSSSATNVVVLRARAAIQPGRHRPAAMHPRLALSALLMWSGQLVNSAPTWPASAPWCCPSWPASTGRRSASPPTTAGGWRMMSIAQAEPRGATPVSRIGDESSAHSTAAGKGSWSTVSTRTTHPRRAGLCLADVSSTDRTPSTWYAEPQAASGGDHRKHCQHTDRMTSSEQTGARTDLPTRPTRTALFSRARKEG
jgi:hypothetical protein